MAMLLSDVEEDEYVVCGVCEKSFLVKDMSLDDWNFAWDMVVEVDSCNDCRSGVLRFQKESV